MFCESLHCMFISSLSLDCCSSSSSSSSPLYSLPKDFSLLTAAFSFLIFQFFLIFWITLFFCFSVFTYPCMYQWEMISIKTNLKKFLWQCNTNIIYQSQSYEAWQEGSSQYAVCILSEVFKNSPMLHKHHKKRKKKSNWKKKWPRTVCTMS